MTEAEKNEIVGLVMTEISSQAVDFDIATEQPQANDLLTAVRETESGGYRGVTIKWDDVARIATELANQAATRAEQAKTNVENMKSSVEQTVTDFNALADQKKSEVESVYQTDLNELKGDLDELIITYVTTNEDVETVGSTSIPHYSANHLLTDYITPILNRKIETSNDWKFNIVCYNADEKVVNILSDRTSVTINTIVAGYSKIRISFYKNDLSDVNPTDLKIEYVDTDIDIERTSHRLDYYDEKFNMLDNLILQTTFTVGGFIDSNGNVSNNDVYKYSDYIKVRKNNIFIPIEYQVKIGNSVYFGLYDKNKNFVKSLKLTDSTSSVVVNGIVDFEDDVYYCRISCDVDYTPLVKYSSRFNETVIYETSSNPCDYEGDEIRVFKKIICIGDSITHGTFNHNENGNEEYITYPEYAYPQYLRKLSGVEVVNKGLGGRTSVMWWNECKNDDFSGYDCAIINLGINDYYQNVSEVDTRQAFANIINALKSANNGIKIFIANITPAYTEGKTIFDNINAIIKNIAENTENAYFLDMTQYSHCNKNTPYEAGHLSAIGYLRWAEDYHNYISYIISQNLNDFKFVQFIGTDYTYTD